MADVAWVTLSIRPWDDAWLAEDDALAEAFRQLDLTSGGYRGGDGRELAGAMNGSRDDNEEIREVTLSGEMRGGSWEIKSESNLLEALRARGIAYILRGDAKYDWDGDEEWWHPGMDAPFVAAAGAETRYLDKATFDRLAADEYGSSEDLASLVHGFFEADPYAWVAPPGYVPTLNPDEGESS